MQHPCFRLKYKDKSHLRITVSRKVRFPIQIEEKKRFKRVESLKRRKVTITISLLFVNMFEVFFVNVNKKLAHVY